MTSQLKPLEAYRSKINVFSGLRVPLDDNPNYQHWSGAAAAATGISPTKQSEFDSKTIDQQIADVISHGTRFKSVSASAAGDPKQSYSSLGGANTLPAEASPLSLYTRLFGPGFQDPTKGDWKPDPQVMIQQSVLSVVADDRKRVMQNLGRRRPRPHGPVFHFGARGRTADGGGTATPRNPGQGHDTRRAGGDGVQQRAAEPAQGHADHGAAGCAGAGHRPDPGVQPQRLRARLADLHAGRLAGLPPVHP